MSGQVETTEYAGFVRRALRGYARRVADADDVDLGQMAELVKEFGTMEVTVVAALRARGETWEYIGRGLGITRSSAYNRYGKRVEALG